MAKWIQKSVASMRRRGTIGAFTRWAKSRGFKSASSAVSAGLHSKSLKTRRRAQWVKNIRKRH